MILRSQQSTKPIEREYEVGFATRAQGPSKTYILQVRVPRALLGEIGDPKRIVIAGKPQEGYTIRAATDRHEGLVVNYGLPGHLFFFTTAFKPTKLAKIARRLTTARARCTDGIIRVGGMPEGWINGDSAFAAKLALAVDGGEHVRLTANPASGMMTVRPQATDETAAITARLNDALANARTLKAALEQQTGLKFRVTQNLRLVLAESPR